MDKSDSVIIVIPARYGSSRLPGKPLADIHGKPMIQHVYERALEVRGVKDVIIAIDDERVANAISNFGGKFMMTSPNHESGTDRLVEVMQYYDAEIYINLQGDEPLIRPTDIEKLVDSMFRSNAVSVGTLYHPISIEDAKDPNIVKVILSHQGEALYFSRSMVPYPRDIEFTQYYKHVGIYAYRKEILRKYTSLPQSQLEAAEKLEQLRLLTAGVGILGVEVEALGPGVDTPESLAHVRQILSNFH